MVKQSHKDYEILAEVEAPQPLIDDSVKQFACRNAACGISDELKSVAEDQKWNKPCRKHVPQIVCAAVNIASVQDNEQ